MEEQVRDATGAVATGVAATGKRRAESMTELKIVVPQDRAFYGHSIQVNKPETTKRCIAYPQRGKYLITPCSLPVLSPSLSPFNQGVWS